MKKQTYTQNNFSASFKKQFLKFFSKIKNGIKLRYKYLIKNYYFRKIINQVIFLYKMVKPKILVVYSFLKKYFNPIIAYVKIHTKIVSVGVIILLLLVLYLLNNKNTYTVYLFYPDKFDPKLKYERREIALRVRIVCY